MAFTLLTLTVKGGGGGGGIRSCRVYSRDINCAGESLSQLASLTRSGESLHTVNSLSSTSVIIRYCLVKKEELGGCHVVQLR